MRALLLVTLLLGCARSEAPARGMSSPAAPPAPTPEEQRASASTADASPLPPPPASPGPAREALQNIGGCFATPSERSACQKQGPSCRLDAVPELPPPSPCANKGTRCLDEMGPRQAIGPCMCTCSQEYIQRRQAVEQALAARSNQAEDGSYSAQQKAYEDCQAQQAAKAKKHPGRPIPKCPPPDRLREPQLPQ